MFLRKNTKWVNGESYDYWTLWESVRTPRGPRQRVVASVGKLDSEEIQASWDQIEDLLEGRQAEPRQMRLGEGAQSKNDNRRWELADLENLTVERVREFGSVYLALALWKRLGLHQLLNELLPEGREAVPWADVANILVVGCFCSQRSELMIAQDWYARTALEDLVGVDLKGINDDRLYRALDILGSNKDALCEHLMKRYRDWFGVRFEFLLYDVTSTSFEGESLRNEKAARGYSRDKRSDGKQVCLGLVCTVEGLPLAYEVYAGNRNEVTTVRQMVSKMEQRFGQAERIWVMDRGMVSEENIDFLRAKNARYLVGTPQSSLRHFEADLLEKGNWKEVQEGLEAKLLEPPDGKGEEKYVLCRSRARKAKEQAMLCRQREGLTHELTKIEASLRKRKKKQSELEQLGRRIGRWQGKYPAAAKLLEARIETDEKGNACGLRLSCPQDRGQQAEQRKGAYLLRTNCRETDPAQICWYIQLTQAEAAFRISKPDIGLRPIYHQKTDRVEAPILVCFLALEMWMSSKGLGSSARKLLDAVATIRSMDVVVPVRRGQRTIKGRLRTVAKPDKDVSILLAHLGLRLPRRTKIVENVVEKIG